MVGTSAVPRTLFLRALATQCAVHEHSQLGELLLQCNELFLLCCHLLVDEVMLPLGRVRCVVRELIVHVWSQPEYYRKPRGQESD